MGPTGGWTTTDATNRDFWKVCTFIVLAHSLKQARFFFCVLFFFFFLPSLGGVFCITFPPPTPSLLLWART